MIERYDRKGIKQKTQEQSAAPSLEPITDQNKKVQRNIYDDYVDPVYGFAYGS